MNNFNVAVPTKGYVIHTEDTTWLYAVFRTSEVQEFIKDFPDHADLAAALTGWTEFSRGPGRAFGYSPSVRIGKRNVIVRQMCGLDI